MTDLERPGGHPVFRVLAADLVLLGGRPSRLRAQADFAGVGAQRAPPDFGQANVQLNSQALKKLALVDAQLQRRRHRVLAPRRSAVARHVAAAVRQWWRKVDEGLLSSDARKSACHLGQTASNRGGSAFRRSHHGRRLPNPPIRAPKPTRTTPLLQTARLDAGGTSRDWGPAGCSSFHARDRQRRERSPQGQSAVVRRARVLWRHANAPWKVMSHPAPQHAPVTAHWRRIESATQCRRYQTTGSSLSAATICSSRRLTPRLLR
jgi:hypothetical protein